MDAGKELYGGYAVPKKRLYIVEGLPCSGKSTTSKYVADMLGKNYSVSCIDEGSGDHPSDYEYHAYVSKENKALFSAHELEIIAACSEQYADGYIVPLCRFDGELHGKLMRYKIYDFLPWADEMPVMLHKWENFCRTADENKVYVFNCVMLQNPMCETMMRFGFCEEQSFEYISQIAQLIKSMEPVIIYLKNDDIRESVINAAKEREGWLEAVIDYHENGMYAKSINAKGFDGYISCLEQRQKRELNILSMLPTESIVMENAHRDWAAAYEKISRFIC